MPKVSINVVLYNGLKYLKPCFDSIFNQTFKDFEVIAIDNNVDNDADAKFMKENFPSVRLIENKKNTGFAVAHNQAIGLNNSDYILVTNQDIILEPDFLEKLVNFMDANPDYGSCGGKLMKMSYDNNNTVETNGRSSLQINNSNFYKIGIIDCIAIDHTKGFRFFNLGEGEDDNGQFNESCDIFGVSGALGLYRRSSLERIKDKNGYFDERFFLYKEDVDLAWRLYNIGQKARYIADAVSYHERGFSGKNNQNIVEIIERKSKDKAFLAKLSYRNHLWMLKKNLKGFNLFVLIEEIKKAGFNFIFRNKVFREAWREIKHNVN